jgi:hypothetical protein
MNNIDIITYILNNESILEELINLLKRQLQKLDEYRQKLESKIQEDAEKEENSEKKENSVQNTEISIEKNYKSIENMDKEIEEIHDVILDGLNFVLELCVNSKQIQAHLKLNLSQMISKYEVFQIISEILNFSYRTPEPSLKHCPPKQESSSNPKKEEELDHKSKNPNEEQIQEQLQEQIEEEKEKSEEESNINNLIIHKDFGVSKIELIRINSAEIFMNCLQIVPCKLLLEFLYSLLLVQFKAYLISDQEKLNDYKFLQSLIQLMLFSPETGLKLEVFFSFVFFYIFKKSLENFSEVCWTQNLRI